MSYTYLQGLEEASSEVFSLDILPSALSRLNPTADASSSSGNETESFQGSLCGMTFAPSTPLLGADQLMSSVPESPARKSQAQTETLTTPDFFSLTTTPLSSASFARFDRHRSLWKTATNSSTVDSPVFSGSWPKWGMMQDGACSVREALICPTKDTELGSWPTPTATDYKGGTAAIRKDTGKVRMDLVRHVCKVRFGLTYPIPEHSEALMGWPIGWTDLKPLATDKFRGWLRSHGEP